MKSITLTACATTLGLLGLMALSTPVHANEVKGQSKDSNTHVTITDASPTDPAVLKLINVPDQFNFKTKLQSDGSYDLNANLSKPDQKITVFNDKSTQDWSVKASIADKELSTMNGKTANVTGFTINGQSLMGPNANQIVSKAATMKTIENNTGYISKEVDSKGISIQFSNSEHNLKAGDILTGTVHYQLYDTPDAK